MNKQPSQRAETEKASSKNGKLKSGFTNRNRFVFNILMTLVIVCLTVINIYLNFFYEKDELQVIFDELNPFVPTLYDFDPTIYHDSISPHLVFINNGTVDIVVVDITIDLISRVRGIGNHFLYYHSFKPIVVPSKSIKSVELGTIWFPRINVEDELENTSGYIPFGGTLEVDFESEHLIRNGYKEPGKGIGIEYSLVWQFKTIGPIHGECMHTETYGFYTPFSDSDTIIGVPFSDRIKIRYKKESFPYMQRLYWNLKRKGITNFYISVIY